MTCDKLNGKLENIANNNNVVEPIKPEKYQSNGTQMNGKSHHKPAPVVMDEEELETRKSLMILATIFITALIAMFYIYKNFPRMDE